MSGSSSSPIILDDDEKRSPVGRSFPSERRSFSRRREDKSNSKSNSLDDSGGHFDIIVEDLEEEMSASQGTSSNNSSGFLSRFRQRERQRHQDQLAYAAAVAEAERLNANRKRQSNIAELRGAIDAASADLMAQILKTSTDQLEIQRRTNIVLQDLSTALAALTSNQTDLLRSMALQEERIRQLGTMTSTLATQVQGIQAHLNSTLPLPPSYEDVVDVEGEVQL